MTVLLTGATGFTGSHVLALLRERGVRVRCLVRPRSDRSLLPPDAPIVEGDIGDAASLDRALDGVDALVNTASLGFGHAPVLVAAAERARVRRAIFISTTAVFTSLNAKSRSVRLAAEAEIEGNALDYTILRPTMIYGSARDRNMVRLIRFLRRWRVLPVIGSGEHLQQPVYVGDVAAAVVQALDAPAASRRAFNVSGGTALTFNAVIDTIAALLRIRVWKLHLPAAPFTALLGAFERAGLRLPVKKEQIERLNEDKSFDHADAARAFGYAPLSFEEGMRRELAVLGLLR
jgi:nucleoside-diphosphate-sugar epimerase